MKFSAAIFCILFMSSCGYEQISEQSAPIELPPANPAPEPIPGGFIQVFNVMNKYCFECHADSAFMKSEKAFRESSAKERVQNGTMPPSDAPQMAESDKQIIVGF